MNDIYTGVSTRQTPQREAARPEQVKNNAGGYVFQVTPETAVRRFLILGTDRPTYYSSAQALTKDAAQSIIEFARQDGKRLVEIIVEISLAGRAPKQQPTMLALAIAASIGNGKEEALRALPMVCRTSTHLFLFVKYVEQFRGWGRALKRAVANWYTSKSPDSLAYQAIKYRQREGWTHRDVLRLAKPKGVTGRQAEVVQWIVKGDEPENEIIRAFESAQRQDAENAARMVVEHNLPWEAIPDQFLNDKAVLSALVRNMGMTALIRNLSRFSRVFGQQDMVWNLIAARLRDPEQIRQARIHPVNVLVALRTYQAGRNEHHTTWVPNTKVIDALDEAYYAAFGNIEPANKRTMIGLDVSGSMSAQVATGLSAREASCALAMSIVATEPDYGVFAFTRHPVSTGWTRESVLTPMDISKRQRLDDVVRMSAALSPRYGGTDCSLPMIGAMENGLLVDTFIIFTDNETWAGRMHPFQALKQYRESMGIDAKLIVVGMTSTNFSIADPSDPGMLDVVGFDSALPTLIADFSAGR